MGLAFAYTLARLDQAPHPIVLLFVLLFSWFVYTILQGRNWARIILLVLVSLGVVPIGLSLHRLIMLNPALAAIQTVQTILQCASLYLLFTNPGRDWFRRPPES